MDFIGKLPGWVLAIAMAVIAASFGYVAISQPPHFEYAGFGFGSRQQADLSFENAVVAFDGKCPTGWTDVGLNDRERFAGRVLVAAGPPTDRANDGSTIDRAHNDQGGEEQHTLTIKETPGHNHSLISGRPGEFVMMNFNGPGNDAGVLSRYKADDVKPFEKPTDRDFPTTAVSGDGRPHNNMPPYIVLYFCKKAG